MMRKAPLHQHEYDAFLSLAYNIRAVLPDPTARRHITLMCESL